MNIMGLMIKLFTCITLIIVFMVLAYHVATKDYNGEKMVIFGSILTECVTVIKDLAIMAMNVKYQNFVKNSGDDESNDQGDVVERLTVVQVKPNIRAAVSLMFQTSASLDHFNKEYIQESEYLQRLKDDGTLQLALAYESKKKKAGFDILEARVIRALDNKDPKQPWSAWAVLPKCKQYVFFFSVNTALRSVRSETGDMKLNETKEATYVVTSDAEKHVVSELLPFCLNGVDMSETIVSVKDKAAQATKLYSSTQSTPVVIVMIGTVEEVKSVFVQPFPEESKSLVFLKYGDDIDTAKMQHMHPFLHTGIVDVNVQEEQKNDTSKEKKGESNNNPVLHKLIAVDTLIVTTHKQEKNDRDDEFPSDAEKVTTAFLEAIYEDQDVLMSTNYYVMLSTQSKEDGFAYRFEDNVMAVLDSSNVSNSDKATKNKEPPGLSVGRNSTQILEQFDNQVDGNVAVKASANVPGYIIFNFGGAQKVFEPTDIRYTEAGSFPVIDGVVLHSGDRVRLSLQSREDENDDYVVIPNDKDKTQLVLVNVRPAYLQASEMNVEFTGGKTKKQEESPEASSLEIKNVQLSGNLDWWREGDLVILPQLGNELASITHIQNQSAEDMKEITAVGFSPTDASAFVPDTGEYVTATVVVQFASPRTSTEDESSYMCVTDSTIKNKYACESARDAFGRPKPGGADVWDAPCKNNTDCPFFQANTNHKNYRGGCISGYCEMPLGVQRVGYRKYARDESSYPLCHGCDDTVTAQKQCCASQQPSPNYAFELDQFERS